MTTGTINFWNVRYSLNLLEALAFLPRDRDGGSWRRWSGPGCSMSARGDQP